MGRQQQEQQKVFTVYVRFPGGGLEEIDVRAQWPAEARREAQAQLDRGDYEHGGQIVEVVERVGFFI